MLKEEEIKKVVDGYYETFKKNGISEGLIYDADTEITSQGTPIKVTGVAFGINKFRFSQYPHIEAKLINSNFEEVINIVFMSDENCGEPLSEYNLNNLRNDIIFSIDKIEDFVKDIKFGKLKAGLYLNEKKRLEEQLATLTKIIEENGIKEE